MPWNSSVFDVAQSCVTCFINALTHVNVEILFMLFGGGVNRGGGLVRTFSKRMGVVQHNNRYGIQDSASREARGGNPTKQNWDEEPHTTTSK